MNHQTRIKRRMLSAALALVLLVTVLPITAASANTYTADLMHAASTFSTNTAVKADGTLWGWSAVLPTGTANVTTEHGYKYQNTPTQLDTGYIAAGLYWYLKEDRTLWVWDEYDDTPVKVMDGVAQASIGGDLKWQCAVALKTDGTLWGWGDSCCLTGEGDNYEVPSASPILLLDNVVQAESTWGWMALRSDGTLWSAGINNKGNLLPSDNDYHSIPLTKVMDGVAAFSLGFQNTMVIKADGGLWSWGENVSGQVGNGIVSSTWQATPVKIMDDVIYAKAGYTAYAITPDGTLYGWGDNGYSILGFAGELNQATPRQMTTNVAAVTSGGNSTAVLKRDGTLWTCGVNSTGQTGHSTGTYPKTVPTLTKLMDGVALPGGMTAVADTTTKPDSSDASGTVGQSTRPVTIFVDGQGRINRLRIQGFRVTNYDTMEVTSDNRKLLMMTYSSDYMLLESRDLDIELTYIAGLFPGKDYNFLVFYDYNLDEKANVEVLRVVKYSKDWVRLGHASVYGGEIRSYGMGYGGNFSFAEYNGMLYIHTAQSMYKSGDGLNHQTNLTMSIRTSDMVMTDSSHVVAQLNTGYVSHSRGQDVLVDSEGNLVTLDNGDAYPIGASLFRNGKKAGADTYRSTGEAAVIKTWPMGTGDWYTGSWTWGLAETRDGYLSAYMDSGMGSKFDSTKHTLNAYVALTPRDNFTAAATKTYAVTSLPAGARETVYSMQLVPVSLDGGYVIVITREQDEQGQNNTYHMHWAKYSADGSVTALKRFSNGAVADGNVVYANNQLLWLEYDETPTTHISQLDNIYHNYYTFDGTTLTYHSKTAPSLAALPDFSDVPGAHWAYAYVNKAASNSLVQGVGDNKFDPERNVSNAEWATMLVNLFYRKDTGRSGDYWWSANMDIAGAQRNILAGTAVAANGTGNWDASKVQSGINRYDMAQVIYNIAKEQGWALPDTSAASSQIADWSSVPANYRDAVAYCFSAGLVTGIDSRGTFSGNSTMTRAQAATVLCRLLDAKNGS